MAILPSPPTARVHGWASAGSATITTASSTEPSSTEPAEGRPVAASTMVSSVAMNRVWWPVRKTYRSGVKRARTRLSANPAIMVQATWAPNSSWAMATIASLVGTTPWAPVAPWIIVPKGSRAAVTRPAPAPMSRKPSTALRPPPTTCPVDRRSAISPTAVIRPTM